MGHSLLGHGRRYLPACAAPLTMVWGETVTPGLVGLVWPTMARHGGTLAFAEVLSSFAETAVAETMALPAATLPLA
jgi:hypothetical protein